MIAIARRRGERGFTLIELLLVLSIIMTISIFSYSSFQSYYQKRQLDSFMEQFEKDILYTQIYGISQSKNISIQFLKGFYRVRTYFNEPIVLERYHDEKIVITFLGSNMGSQIAFNNKGNIQKSGKIQVSYEKQTYTMVFQLGKGRFYYE